MLLEVHPKFTHSKPRIHAKKFSGTLDETEKAAARARKSDESIHEQEAEYMAAARRRYRGTTSIT